MVELLLRCTTLVPGYSSSYSSFIGPFLLLAPSSRYKAGRPGSSEVPRDPLTRWDVNSIPANGIFLTKKLKN